MMRKRLVFLVLVMLLWSASPLFAEWRIEVESKTVFAGQEDVSLNILASWDNGLAAVTIPLVIKEIDPGSFWSGDLPYDTANTYFNTHPFAYNVDWRYTDWCGLGPCPWTSPPIIELRPLVPEVPCDPVGDIGYDGISPDHFAVIVDLQGACTYAEPSLQPFVTIAFDVTENPGVFEIDTGCVSGSLSTIYMIDCEFPPVDHGPTGTGETAFNKGVITITECSCAGLGDMDGNGLINPVDVAYMVGAVYLGYELPIPGIFGCPVPNGDWDCNGVRSPLDLAYLIHLVYRSRPVVPCDPCSGGWLPDLTITEDDLYFNPAQAEVGEDVGIWISIRNIGMDTAFSPQLDIYQGDPDAGGILLGNGTTIDIPPGGTSGPYGGFFSFDEPGTIAIYGVADYPDLIVEYNEANNKAFMALDVIQAGIIPKSEEPKPGTPIQLRPLRATEMRGIK
jgi:hypothetical protein